MSIFQNFPFKAEEQQASISRDGSKTEETKRIKMIKLKEELFF